MPSDSEFDIDTAVSRFMKVYSSLPLPERELPIVVVDNEPVSWNRARIEIEGKTEIGEKILRRLVELDII